MQYILSNSLTGKPCHKSLIKRDLMDDLWWAKVTGIKWQCNLYVRLIYTTWVPDYCRKLQRYVWSDIIFWSIWKFIGVLLSTSQTSYKAILQIWTSANLQWDPFISLYCLVIMYLFSLNYNLLPFVFTALSILFFLVLLPFCTLK